MRVRLFIASVLFVVSLLFPQPGKTAGCPQWVHVNTSNGYLSCNLRSENSDGTCTYYNRVRAGECTRISGPGPILD